MWNKLRARLALAIAPKEMIAEPEPAAGPVCPICGSAGFPITHHDDTHEQFMCSAKGHIWRGESLTGRA